MAFLFMLEASEQTYIKDPCLPLAKSTTLRLIVCGEVNDHLRVRKSFKILIRCGVSFENSSSFNDVEIENDIRRKN